MNGPKCATLRLITVISYDLETITNPNVDVQANKKNEV